jgi:hypothetical protein
VTFAALRAEAARAERIRKQDDKTIGHELIGPFRIQLRLGIGSLIEPAAIMQGDNRRERPGAFRAIQRRMQGELAIRNIDLLRCGNRFRTGERSDDDQSQGPVSHGIAALVREMAPRREITMPSYDGAGRSKSKAGGRAGLQAFVAAAGLLCFGFRIRACRVDPAPDRMHGGDGA